MKRWLVALALLGVSLGVYAQVAQCWWASVTYNSVVYRGETFMEAAVAVCGPHAAAGNTAQFTYSCHAVTSCNNSNAPGSGQNAACTYTRRRLCPACSPANQDILEAGIAVPSLTSVQDDCPPPEECEAEIGHGFWNVSSTPISGSTWCNERCEMTAGASSCGGPPGLQTCTTWASVTGLQCEGSEDSNGDGVGDDGGPATDPPDGTTPGNDDGGGDPPGEAGESCVAVGDGEYCGAPNGDGQCGYVNDTYTCLDKIKDDECKVLGDGSRLCGGNATTTPPVPDNGTAGVLATPDGQMSQAQPGDTPGIPGSTVSNFNYYGSATVAGSSRDPGTTGASGASSSGSPHAPLPGEGDGDGGGTGGGGECTTADCDAEVPTLEEIGTLSEAMGQFWSDLQEVPIISAAADIAPSFGAGSCPDWSTSVALYSANIEVDFTSACTIWSDISPALGAVCLVMFGLLAFRILFSA